MKIKEIITKALSLGTGLAIGILLIANISYELSHDRCYTEPERIYQIRSLFFENGKESDYHNVSGAIAPGFKEYIPGVEYATRMTPIWNSDKFSDENKNIISGSIIAADTSFFDVFDTEILTGNPKDALSQRGSAMVSESFADKLGGATEALGKIIFNEESPNFPITINGVFADFPHHSSVKRDVLLSMESMRKESTENWVGNDRYSGYVRLMKGTDPDMLAPAIRDMQMNNYPAEAIKSFQESGLDLQYYLAPLNRQYLKSEQVRITVLILSIVAVLLIAISLLNYILFSVSAISNRSKEIGVRKCYGAGQRNIYGIMFKEAVVDVLAAIVVAIIIILFFRPIIEDITGVPASALLVNATYTAVALILVIVFLVAAVVPGYLYSRIPAQSAIRNYSENKRIWKLSLLFVQTAICALLLSLVLVINRQYTKAIHDKPGYQYENLLWTVLTGTDNKLHQGIVDELKRLPEVLGVEMSYGLPLDSGSGNNVIDGDKHLFNIADQYEGTAGLFDLLGIPFIEGRYPQSPLEVAVSESFLTEMAKFEDWSNGAVGKQIYVTEHSKTSSDAFTISGVYKDYRMGTLTGQDSRASIKFLGEIGEDWMPFMAIKVNEVSRELIEKVQNIIQSRIENRVVEVKAYKDSMREAYSGERRTKNTVIIGCVVSIVIALFGLIGYIRDESQRRSKEMAIRKINGASVKEIITIYIKEVLKIGIVALILGNAGAYYAAHLWLRNFSEKITLSPWYFIVADIIIIILIITTIVLNSLRISRANPVESLKNE
jgi:putative ABC transport system permease protein